MSKKEFQPGRRRFLGATAATAAAAGLVATGTTLPGTARAQGTAPTGPLRDPKGKVAFITGGSSGIGLGQAKVFHEAGMKVAIGYIRDDQAESALAQFRDGRDRVMLIKADVTDRAQVKRAADEVEANFGKVHLVSANAGVGVGASIGQATLQDFDWTVGVNFVGVFNTIHEFLPRIRRHGEGGHVIATSSMSGLLPTEGGGAGIYTATKFAVVGMMEALRAELDAAKENIGCSVYCPGFVNTSIYQVEKNRPASFAAEDPKAAADAAEREKMIAGIMGVGMDPVEAARIVFDGIRHNDCLILTHPEFLDGLRERGDYVLAAVPRGTAPKARTDAVGVTLHNSLYVRERDRKPGSRRRG